MRHPVISLSLLMAALVIVTGRADDAVVSNMYLWQVLLVF